MGTITRLKAKFGHSAPVPVEKITNHKRSLTEAIQSTLELLDETIAIVSEIKDLRRITKNDFKSPMCKKVYGNLAFKIGYGKNNAKISEDLSEIFFTSKEEALACMVEARKMILEGALDHYMKAHIKKMSAQSANARSGKSAKKKKNTSGLKSGDPVKRVTTVFPIKKDEEAA